MKPVLASIRIYPLKSGAPTLPGWATVEPRGLAGDRRWMVVDAAGLFVTARKHPRLVLIQAKLEDAGLLLEAPDMPALRLAPTHESARVAVTVWRDGVMARIADAGADHWISRYLGMAARFVHMDADAARGVDPAYSRSGDQVSFADGFPLLLISQASLDGLNTRLDSAVTMNRFRPNLVVGGTNAHAEDDWRRIRVGEVEFDVVKRCARCVLTTVDPDTGRFDAQGEPLRTLIGYRRTEKGVMFGQNLIPRGTGRIRQGDTVEVIA